MAEQVKIFEVQITGSDEAVNELNQIEAALKRNRKERNELIKKESQGNQLTKEETKRLNELTLSIEKQNQQKRKLATEIRNTTKLQEEETTSINGLQARLNLLTSQWKALSSEQRENTDRGRALGKEIEGLNKKIREQKEGVGDNTSSIGNYEDAINKALKSSGLYNTKLGQTVVKAKAVAAEVKGVATAQKTATTATSGASKALKIFKVALISTGIGALVVALGSLVTLFTQTKSGTEAVSRTFTALGAGVQVIIDRFSTFGSSILKLFTGDLKGAAEGFQESFKGIGAEIANETKAAFESEKQLQRLADEQREFIVERARLNSVIKEARAIANDENVALETRIQKIKEANEAQEQIFKTEEKLARERFEARKIQVEQGESLADELTELAELEAEVFNVQSSNSETRKRLLLEEKRLRNELRSEEKAENQERLENEKERLEIIESELKAFNETVKQLNAETKTETDKLITDSSNELFNSLTEDIELTEGLIDEFTNKFLEDTQETNELLSEIFDNTNIFTQLDERQAALEASLEKGLLSEQKYNEAVKELDKQRLQGQLSLTSDILGKSAALFEENTKAYKVLASGEAVINTYLSATQAYSSLVGVPIIGPALGAAAAAVAIATGLANVAKINNVKFESGGVIQGNSHANGGVPFTVNGLPGFEAEGGEVIINKKSASMFMPELSAINAAGGGRKFANGGFIPQATSVESASRAALELADSTVSRIVNGINDKKVVNDPIEAMKAQNQQVINQTAGDF